MRKPAFCICEKKTQISCTADQRLCFLYRDSSIPLLPKFEISSLQPSSVVVQPICVRPGRKLRRPVFSQRGSNNACFPFHKHMSRVMRKLAFCICENKDADQLRGNREADQRLCFRYTDSTIPLLPISEISSLLQSSVPVQPEDRFSHNEAHI